MQYTLRQIPSAVDKALREKARSEGKSLNEVALEALASGVGLGEEPARHRDLSSVAGTWLPDAGFDAALADQDTVDEEMWR